MCLATSCSVSLLSVTIGNYAECVFHELMGISCPGFAGFVAAAAQNSSYLNNMTTAIKNSNISCSYDT